MPLTLAQFGGFGGGGGFRRGFGGAGGGGFQNLLNRMAQEEDEGRFAAPPHLYDEYYKAYSMAMLPGKERLNVSYGGKSEWRGPRRCVRAARLIPRHQSSCRRRR